MAISKSFDFKNKGEVTFPREVLHAQDLYGIIGSSRGIGIFSGCTITIGATNRIDIASGTIYLDGTSVSFTADTTTLDDSSMSSGQHRWVTVHITSGGAIGTTVGTAISTGLLPVKPTDTTNFVICSVLKTFGSNIVDADVMSSAVDFANSTVITNSDVTDAGSGIIISDAERTALHSIFVPGLVTAHTDVTSAGSGIIISSAERTALHPEVTTLTHTALSGKNSETNIKHLTDVQQSALHTIFTPSTVIADHSDVTDAGSGIIISTGERTALHAKYALTEDLTSNEITQLQAIGATTISLAQWAILGGLSAGLFAAELNYVDGVTSPIQDQLDAIVLSPTMTGWLVDNSIILPDKSYSVGGFTNLQGGFISTDGTVMFLVDDNGATDQTIYAYDLSTPWDVTTAIIDSGNELDVFGDSGQDATGIFFKPDGLELYVVNANVDSMYQYTLSSAWDLTSATLTDSFAHSNQNVADLYISPDGTRVFLHRGNGDVIQSYTMGSAWDLTTISYDGKSVNIAAIVSDSTGVTMSPDGTRVIFWDGTDPAIYEYYMTTPWDLDTLTYNNKSAVAPVGLASNGGLCTNPSGTLLFCIAANEQVHTVAMGHSVGI